MSDIVFILPDEELEGVNKATQTPSLGVAYLVATLIRHNFSCKVIDMTAIKIDASGVLKILMEEGSYAVGISANLFTGRSAIKLFNLIRRHIGENICIIFGCPFPTSSPLKFLKEGRADIVVLGEGERTLLKIMERLKGDNNCRDFDDIAGIACFMEKGEIKINPQQELEKRLDSLPFPAWRLFPSLKLYKTRSRKSPVAPILTSRGCPFNCIYCSKDVFRSLFRPRSPENIIEEIDYLVREFGVRQIDVMDDNFSLQRNRAERILDLIIERDYNLCINLQIGVRADCVDGPLLKKMKKAGVYKIAFGVESGDTMVLQNIKKQLDLKRALDSALLAKKMGMVVYGFFMFGLPQDTKDSMRRTIDFALKMDPHIANFVITIPFPGTKLYEMVQGRGRFLIDTSDGLKTGFYSNRVFYEMDGLKEREVLYYYRLAYKVFYGRLRKLLDIVFTVRSFPEFIWLLQTARSILAPMLKKDRAPTK